MAGAAGLVPRWSTATFTAAELKALNAGRSVLIGETEFRIISGELRLMPAARPVPGGSGKYVKPGYEQGGRWVDPQNQINWLTDLQNGPDTGPMELRTRRTINNNEPYADYQRRVAGPEEYRLRSSTDDPIWADSVHIDPDGVVAVDAKYVKQPGTPSSMYEGTSPEFLLREFDGEMPRYGAVIRDPANPVARLRIITNTDKAAEFLSSRARTLLGPDIDIEVVVIP